jgi:hypothetical protein
MAIGYVETTDLTAYASSRGITIVNTPFHILQKSLDWLELNDFKGEKTDPEQILEFPRNGETIVPERIKTAQMVAALIYDSGGDPMGAIGPKVLMEKVDVISIQYSDKGNQSVLYPQLNKLLKDFVKTSYGANFDVVRA